MQAKEPSVHNTEIKRILTQFMIFNAIPYYKDIMVTFYPFLES